MKIVTLTKLKEAENPRHPNNIEVGFVKQGEFNEPPIVGECFWVGSGWRTSTVQEITSPTTFRTHNSIYQWEVVEK